MTLKVKLIRDQFKISPSIKLSFFEFIIFFTIIFLKINLVKEIDFGYKLDIMTQYLNLQ